MMTADSRYLPIMLAVAFIASGCSDPDSRLGAAFDRGVVVYKKAEAEGKNLTKRTASAPISSLGAKYKHFFAMPSALKPLMTSSAGRVVLERARSSHPDPSGRALASRCLQILDAKRKHSYHLTGPVKGTFMHWHYD